MLGTQERISIYQNIAEEIRFLKRQQWTLTYYVTLVQAAILAFYYNFYDKLDDSIDKWLLCIIAGFFAVVGTYLLFDLHKNLVKNRKRIKEIYGSIGPDDNVKFLGNWSEDGKKFFWSPSKTSYCYQFFVFVLIFGFIMWAGVGIVAWFILRKGLYVWIVISFLVVISIILSVKNKRKLGKDSPTDWY
jgi:hypothetical protein